MPKEITKLSDEERKFFGEKAASEAQKLLDTKPEPIAPEPAPETVERETRGKQVRNPEPELEVAEVSAPEEKAAVVAPGDEAEETEVETANGKVKMVPHQALHQAREREKAAEAKAKEREEENVRLKTQIDEIRKTQTPQPQKQENALPDLESDPVGFVKALAERTQRVEQAYETDKQMSNFQRQVQAAERQFVESTPDYGNAVNYLAQQRYTELTQLYNMSPEAAKQTLTAETQQMAAMALQNNKNPAEFAYTIAKQRGYAKPVEPAPEPTPQDETANVARLQQAQRASRSLSSNSGTPMKGEIDISSFMRMPSAEIAEKAKNDPAFLKKFGGFAKR